MASCLPVNEQGSLSKHTSSSSSSNTFKNTTPPLSPQIASSSSVISTGSGSLNEVERWQPKGTSKKTKYPAMYTVRSDLVASNNNKEISSTMYKVEPIEGRKGKMLLHIKGKDEPIEVDISQKDLTFGLPPPSHPGEEASTSSNNHGENLNGYQRSKRKAILAGELDEFQTYFREKSKARYRLHKSSGLPTHSYQLASAEIRKHVLMQNNPALLQARLEKKKKRDREYRRRKIREDLKNNKKRKQVVREKKVLVFRDEEERQQYIERMKERSRETSNRYNARKRAEKAAAAKNAEKVYAEPSHAGMMVGELHSHSAQQRGVSIKGKQIDLNKMPSDDDSDGSTM